MTALNFTELQSGWTKLVGAAIAGNSEPFAMSGTCLVVKVSARTWHTELQKLEPDILTTLPPVDGVRVRSIRWAYQPPEKPRRAHR